MFPYSNAKGVSDGTSDVIIGQNHDVADAPLTMIRVSGSPRTLSPAIEIGQHTYLNTDPIHADNAVFVTYIDNEGDLMLARIGDGETTASRTIVYPEATDNRPSLAFNGTQLVLVCLSTSTEPATGYMELRSPRDLSLVERFELGSMSTVYFDCNGSVSAALFYLAYDGARRQTSYLRPVYFE